MWVPGPRVERSAVETRAELKTKGLAVQGRRFAAHYFHEVSRAAGPKRQVTGDNRPELIPHISLRFTIEHFTIYLIQVL